MLYAELPNHAEEQREAARKNMLDEVAAEAARMAEALTPPEGSDADADNMRLTHQQKRRVIVQRDRLKRLVKMVGRKDVRSDSMTVNFLSL